MEIVAHHPVGATITDLSIRDVDRDIAARLAILLAEHGVLVLPEQNADDTAFVAFLRQFGGLAFTVGETAVPGFPDLNVVSNVGRTSPPRSAFHVDTSYVRRPPAFTALRAVEVPTAGGATQFTNQYRAFDTLAPALRAELAGRTVTHVVTGLDLADDAETSAEHPVFRRHPRSGRTALYLSTPQRCAAISGVAAERARELVDLLYAHSTAETNVHRHEWAPGDVVIWDNACVLHRADHAGVVGNRVLHRGMVAAP
ncbi:TauD/TfdA dioxygenase family protein [Pseudonocardia abyssalis]|uniref:TauD/TfdA family dioxygenase n=1 Tax=Pseudonocardia abyssalis TaxID=2792008 RepID=A0ABS6UP49_9PSEU|nr:TauD/TfdA family dioxygenase [Pseudonocardia abyssalis]MBW0117125.1 TauD/TfdA family dioxygenase [Pseudonocardia abyssalis]MBW0133952.1 TauD/TfdA family dioxygenase [Pseudonocardia abyssalis]